MITLFRELAGSSYLIKVTVRAVDEYKTYFKHNLKNIPNEYSKLVYVFIIYHHVSQ